MGIRGLYSFVESYDDFFVDVRLRNQRLIIGRLILLYLNSLVNSIGISSLLVSSLCFLADGSNLRYVLYNKCTSLNSAYGGDYAKYYKQVSAFASKYVYATVRGCAIVECKMMERASTLM